MKFNKNVVFSVCLILLASFVIFLSLQLKSLFLSQSGDIGPKAFPIGASIALIFCAIGKIITEARQETKPLFTVKGWRRVALMFAILIVYVAGMKYFGYIISTLVFVPTAVWAMREDQHINLLFLATFSIVMTGMLYFIFENIIMVVLPVGELFIQGV